MKVDISGAVKQIKQVRYVCCDLSASCYC